MKYFKNLGFWGFGAEQARKGGNLVLHSLGSFDKMNPFTLKGTAPDFPTFLFFTNTNKHLK